MGRWCEPPNDLANDSLRQRVEYGYAVAARNPFLERYYRQPGIHQQVDIGAIGDAADTVDQRIDAAQLSSGRYYARLIATPANEPDRCWQVSGNKLYIGDQTYYGARWIDVP